MYIYICPPWTGGNCPALVAPRQPALQAAVRMVAPGWWFLGFSRFYIGSLDFWLETVSRCEPIALSENYRSASNQWKNDFWNPLGIFISVFSDVWKPMGFRNQLWQLWNCFLIWILPAIVQRFQIRKLIKICTCTCMLLCIFLKGAIGSCKTTILCIVR